jgi:CheY-like chemotaxis protein
LPAFASKFQKFCIEKLITDFIKSIKLADAIVALRCIYGFVSAEEKYLENNTSHWQANLINRNTNIKKSYPPLPNESSLWMIILILITFKRGLEAENEYSSSKIFFQVYAYDDPLLALSEFKPNFYDLLVDVNMPKVNGFEFSEKILKLDVNVRVCYISAGEMNIEALREQYPTLSIGCFIKKPITIENLVRKVKAELE